MDGDLDLVAGVVGSLRRESCGTTATEAGAAFPRLFESAVGLRAFAWGDLDGDGDPDAALLDERGTIHVFENQQGGMFQEWPTPPIERVLSLTLADIDRDGRLDLLTLDATGTLRSGVWRGRQWNLKTLASWGEALADTPGTYRLFAEDLDNNGALDLAASGQGQSRIWLAGERGDFQSARVASSRHLSPSWTSTATGSWISQPY
jgi:hypothetical protein